MKRESRAREQGAFRLNQKIPKASNKEEWYVQKFPRKWMGNLEIVEFFPTETKHSANDSGNSGGKNKIERKFQVENFKKTLFYPTRFGVVLFFSKVWNNPENSNLNLSPIGKHPRILFLSVGFKTNKEKHSAPLNGRAHLSVIWGPKKASSLYPWDSEIMMGPISCNQLHLNYPLTYMHVYVPWSIYEINHIWTAVVDESEEWSSQ